MCIKPPLESPENAGCRVHSRVSQPSDKNHILCGRGNVHTRHPGNKRFARIVQESAKEYTKATSRSEKIVIVTSVVSLIRNSGMKFMNFDPIINEYVEIESERYHGKVSHAIRDYIKKNDTVSRKQVTCSKLLARNKKLVARPSSRSTVLGQQNLTTNDVAETSTSFQSSTLKSAAIIFDLGEKIADSIPLLPCEEDILSALCMSPPIASTLTVEASQAVLSSSIEPSLCPLPIDACIEFEEGDLKHLVAVLA